MDLGGKDDMITSEAGWLIEEGLTFKGYCTSTDGK